MGDNIKLVTIGGRKMWDCGDRLLPFVAGADGEGSNGSGDGKGGEGEGKSSMVPEGEEGKGEGEGKGKEGEEDKRSESEKLLDTLRSEMTEREQKLFDRLADASGKQLKNALKDLDLGSKGEGKSKEGEGKSKQEPDPEAAARAEADHKRLVRDSRAAFKEILSDDVRFLGNPERDLAVTLGHGLIVQAISGGGDDEEVIGRAAAETVAKQLRDVRKFYEARTKAGLKRDGLLVETPGQTTRAATQPQADSAFARGAEIAKQRYGPKPAPAGKT